MSPGNEGPSRAVFGSAPAQGPPMREVVDGPALPMHPAIDPCGARSSVQGVD